MLSILLEGEGFRVVLAAEGTEALRLVKDEMPGLVLLDMRMPGMDGWEFSRRFRAQYDHQAPIVVLTAAEDARKRADEIGAEDFLSKPFRIEEVIDKVHGFLEKAA